MPLTRPVRRALAPTSVLVPALLAAALLAPRASAGAAGPTSAKMLAALETVQPFKIRSDLYFLASDELGGRDTPSEGLRVAARFLRARLERLGFKPGAPEGYFYTYELEHKAIDENASVLAWEGKGAGATWRFGQDYFLPNLSDVQELSVSGPVVFAGDGSKDDLAAARVEGKWALVFDGGDEPRDVARYARKAKAKGLILAPGPAYKGEPYEKRFAPALERQRQGSVSWPAKREAQPEGSERAPREPFATVALTRRAVADLLETLRKPATPSKGADLGVTLAETRRLQGQNGRIQVENVCGFWPGDDPLLSKEVLLVTAHYDHVGTQNGVVYNGADDNGSGTSTLLSVAEALAQHGPLRRSVLIMWVSGEEKGLWGSHAWSDNPWLPEGCHAIADVNIDMVGRNAPDKLLVTPTRGRAKDYNGLVKLAESLAPLEGFPKLGSADEYYERSDHFMFAKLGIPVMFLFSDVHEDYHKPTDDPEKIDYDKVSRVARLVLRLLDGLQDEHLDLKK